MTKMSQNEPFWSIMSRPYIQNIDFWPKTFIHYILCLTIYKKTDYIPSKPYFWRQNSIFFYFGVFFFDVLMNFLCKFVKYSLCLGTDFPWAKNSEKILKIHFHVYEPGSRCAKPYLQLNVFWNALRCKNSLQSCKIEVVI